MTQKITDAEFGAAFDDLHTPIRVMFGLAEQITDKTGISLEEMKGKSRGRFVVRARHLLMFKASQQNISTHCIGNYLNRDHATVMYGIRRVKRKMKATP